MILFRPMHTIQPAIGRAFYLPGLAFEILVRMRSGFYSSGLLVQRRLPLPVISIGNITMGGTGKTPFVIFVARMLSGIGYSPAVLTRGYGRIRSGELHIVSPGETVPSPENVLGDEPALIRRHIPYGWMGVSKHRYESGKTIANREPRTVFILDDGFQHRSLRRDLDIVIVDSTQPLGQNRLFPRGTLREPLSGLGRCDLVVINGTDSTECCSAESEIRNWNKRAKIFYCRQTITALIPFHSWKETATAAKHVADPAAIQSAYLAAAVGNPERFQRDVRQMGIAAAGAKFFPDHHRFTNREWQDCIEDARRKQIHTIITTEKDAVKIAEAPDFPLLVAVQATQVDDSREFELALRRCIEERR